MTLRNRAVCAGVRTATGGRIPVRSQPATLAAVHTTGLGRRGAGSSARDAALTTVSPTRMAAFSAAHSVAATLARAAAVTGRPAASCCVRSR
jgi:hypothetical protein